MSAGTESQAKHVRVSLSDSHDLPEHKKRVLHLSNRVRVITPSVAAKNDRTRFWRFEDDRGAAASYFWFGFGARISVIEEAPEISTGSF